MNTEVVHGPFFLFLVSIVMDVTAMNDVIIRGIQSFFFIVILLKGL